MRRPLTSYDMPGRGMPRPYLYFLPEGGRSLLPVVAVVFHCADNLVVLVPLPCQQDDVARSGEPRRQTDGVPAGFHHDEPLPGKRRRQLIRTVLRNTEGNNPTPDLGHDEVRLFRPGIVGGDDRQLAQVGGNPPHDRALPLVSIATAAEQGDNPGRSYLPKGLEDVLQGVAGV